MNDSLQKQREYLQSLPDRQSLEFLEGLQALLKGMYRHRFSDVAGIVDEFRADLLQNGIFYMDILNDCLLFLLQGVKNLPPLQINLILLIIEAVLPICNRKSLPVLQVFSKKIAKGNPEILSQIREYKEEIQKHLESIEQQMSQLRLHSYKDILDECPL